MVARLSRCSCVLRRISHSVRPAGSELSLQQSRHLHGVPRLLPPRCMPQFVQAVCDLPKRHAILVHPPNVIDDVAVCFVGFARNGHSCRFCALLPRPLSQGCGIASMTPPNARHAPCTRQVRPWCVRRSAEPRPLRQPQECRWSARSRVDCRMPRNERRSSLALNELPSSATADRALPRRE
jgi:hypothetical protein